MKGVWVRCALEVGQTGGALLKERVPEIIVGQFANAVAGIHESLPVGFGSPLVVACAKGGSPEAHLKVGVVALAVLFRQGTFVGSNGLIIVAFEV